MRIYSLSDFVGGWVIGDFDPAMLRTADFEVGIKQHMKGEPWPVHVHRIATEYNIVVSGRMVMRGSELSAGQMFVIEPGEPADPEFLEDCTVVTVKVPSLPHDKYTVTV